MSGKLAAVTRYRIRLIEMRMLPDVTRDFAARVHADLKVASGVDLLDSAQLGVRNAQVPGPDCRACSNPRGHGGEPVVG